jgi:hypothetical protein
MQNHAELVSSVLEAARAIAASATEAEVREALAALPASLTDGGRVEYVAGAGGAPEGTASAPVRSRGGRVGELRQSGGDAAALPVLASLVGSTLDAISTSSSCSRRRPRRSSCSTARTASSG